MSDDGLLPGGHEGRFHPLASRVRRASMRRLSRN
jgi:hypothetical protein